MSSPPYFRNSYCILSLGCHFFFCGKIITLDSLKVLLTISQNNSIIGRYEISPPCLFNYVIRLLSNNPPLMKLRTNSIPPFINRSFISNNTPAFRTLTNVNKTSINAFLLDKLIVCTFLNNFSMIDN